MVRGSLHPPLKLRPNQRSLDFCFPLFKLRPNRRSLDPFILLKIPIKSAVRGSHHPPLKTPTKLTVRGSLHPFKNSDQIGGPWIPSSFQKFRPNRRSLDLCFPLFKWRPNRRSVDFFILLKIPTKLAVRGSLLFPFLKGWRDPRTVDLVQIFKGGRRDPRTADLVGIFKRMKRSTDRRFGLNLKRGKQISTDRRFGPNF